ncbi:MAG TPA: leucine-rich repeat domain-containing protein [bacterium]|nr:leucine-rich repeat domain-containing protein [bacterium]
MTRIVCLIPLFLLIVACGPGDEEYDPCTDETVIAFPDPAMDSCIRTEAGIYHDGSPIRVKDVCHQKYISCIDSAISDLTGLEKMPWLVKLDFNGNPITSLEPLSNSLDLEMLDIGGGGVSSLTPLSNNTKMILLNASGNQNISDLKPLENKIAMEKIYIGGNQISSISSLANMTGLRSLSFMKNKIEDISVTKGLLELELLDMEDNCVTDFSPIEYLKENGNLKTIYGDSAEEQDYARCQ